MTVAITRWPSVTATQGTRVELPSWQAWFDVLSQPGALDLVHDPATGQPTPHKKTLAGWSPATFRDDRRTNALCEGLCALVLDYDGGTSLDQAVALWGAYEGFVHTSPSHQLAEGHDRFRVILPLRRTVTVEEYAPLWQWASAKAQAAGHPFDDSTKDPSRLWFLPAALPEAPFETRVLRGTTLDPDPVLPVRSRPEPRSHNAPEDPPMASRATSDRIEGDDTAPDRAERYARAALARACETLRTAPEGTRNATLNKEAFSLAGLVVAGALSEDVVHAALRDAALEAGLGAHEVTHALQSGLKAGLHRPREVPSRSRPTGGPQGSRPRGPTPRARRATAAVATYASGPPKDAQEAHTPRFHLTDYGNAERLVAAHGQDLRYCGAIGWLVWDGTRWARNETYEVMRRAKLTIRALYAHAARLEDDRRTALIEHAIRSEKHARLRDMVASTESEPGIAVRLADFDADPWRFNVCNGTIDLSTGHLHAHRREDLLTKRAPVVYDPDASCPLWDAFLLRVQPDPEVRALLDRLAGYALTGVIREHVLPIHYGSGRNGKGTWTDTLLYVMGDYAKQIPTELLMVRQGEAHPTERATLLGCRFAAAVETEQGRSLNVSLVKQLTGGDRISARFMRQDFFDFDPTHKLSLSTNHKPIIRETKDAIWERVMLVPWTVKIPEEERDLSMKEKLRAEAPGILARLVRGCLAWQRTGLASPAVVQAATRAFRGEMDRVQDFLDERCCMVEVSAREGATKLFKCYQSWCESNGMREMSQKEFSEQLVEKGFSSKKSHGVVTYLGIRLLTPFELAERIREATGEDHGANGLCSKHMDELEKSHYS